MKATAPWVERKLFCSSRAIARRPAALAGREAVAVGAVEVVVVVEVACPLEVDEDEPTRVAPVGVVWVVVEVVEADETVGSWVRQARKLVSI